MIRARERARHKLLNGELLAYDDLTWPQVRVLATICRHNLNLHEPPEAKVPVVTEHLNMNSIWALIWRGVVEHDTATNEVWVNDPYLSLASFCKDRVEGRAHER